MVLYDSLDHQKDLQELGKDERVRRIPASFKVILTGELYKESTLPKPGKASAYHLLRLLSLAGHSGSFHGSVTRKTDTFILLSILHIKTHPPPPVDQVRTFPCSFPKNLPESLAEIDGKLHFWKPAQTFIVEPVEMQLPLCFCHSLRGHAVVPICPIHTLGLGP